MKTQTIALIRRLDMPLVEKVEKTALVAAVKASSPAQGNALDAIIKSGAVDWRTIFVNLITMATPLFIAWVNSILHPPAPPTPPTV